MKRLAPTAEMTLGPFFPREFAQGASDLTRVENRQARGEAIDVCPVPGGPGRQLAEEGRVGGVQTGGFSGRGRRGLVLLEDLTEEGRGLLGLGELFLDLAEIEARVVDDGIEPRPRSGAQERLENLVNQRVWAVDRDR